MVFIAGEEPRAPSVRQLRDDVGRSVEPLSLRLQQVEISSSQGDGRMALSPLPMFLVL
jgi:hypothetical protein